MKFAERYGFERGDVTLANWRERPYSTWSFQHTSELVPSAVSAAAAEGRWGRGVWTRRRCRSGWAVSRSTWPII